MQPHPASFVLRFRVCARKFVYFQHRVAKLGPAYLNCNERQSSCTRKKADPRRGCLTCEFTIQHKLFLEETAKELKHLRRTTRAGSRKWPLKKIMESVNEVASLASRKGTNPRWTVAVGLFISVYRDEQSKKRSIDHHQLQAEAEAKAAEAQEKRERNRRR